MGTEGRLVHAVGVRKYRSQRWMVRDSYGGTGTYSFYCKYSTVQDLTLCFFGASKFLMYEVLWVLYIGCGACTG